VSKYKNQAAKEVDSLLKSGHAVNSDARNQTLRQYAMYLKNLEGDKTSADASLKSAQEDSRAKMANRLAARGLGGDGGDQFNYGRLNAQHEGELGSLLKEYMAKRGELLMGQSKDVGSINAQDRALDLSREQKVGELARQLEQDAFSRQMQQAQLALQQRAAALQGRQYRDSRHDAAAAKDSAAEQQFMGEFKALADGGAGWGQLLQYAERSGRNAQDYMSLVPQALYRSLVKGARGQNLQMNIPSWGVDHGAASAAERYGAGTSVLGKLAADPFAQDIRTPYVPFASEYYGIKGVTDPLLNWLYKDLYK
jgi:hypothetical protein